MAATISVTEKDILASLRSYLIKLFGCEVYAAYQNNVPLGRDCIIITLVYERDLTYPIDTWDADAKTITNQQSVQARYQLDFYGNEAVSRARVVNNLWKSQYTTEEMKNLQPLYVASMTKSPIVNESNQYENRVILELELQYNPEVTYSVDYMDSASISVITPDK